MAYRAKGKIKKILIVDDEPDIVELVKVRLEANNYEVITSPEGKEALEKAIIEQPELILLDVMMPGMDGFEVLHRLRADPKTYDIPILMLTCKGETKSIFKADDLRATDYIIKPFEFEELLKCIERYIK